MNSLPLDDLPLVVYEVLFDHLHLIDLARLKRVCKKLHYLVKKYRIKELVIHANENDLDVSTHFDDGRYQNSCIIKPPNLERMLPFRISTRPTESSLFHPHRFTGLTTDPTVRYFSTYTIFLRSRQFNAQFLKSLTCCYTKWDQSNNLTLEEINKLSLLERLEIYFEKDSKSFPMGNCSHGKLSLPHLRTLLLNSKADYSFTMQVEAPRCEGFHLSSTGGLPQANYNQCLRVHFGDPNSVKYLSLAYYHESSHVFKNIEFLQMVGGANLIDGRFFAAFPRLKILKILEHHSLEGLKQLFRLCGKYKVKLVFHGIHLVDDNQLDAFEESDLVQIVFPNGGNPGSDQVFNRLIENYDRLDEDLNFERIIGFTDRIARLLEADAARFLGKFQNLYQISSMIKIENPELFLRLLTSQRNLVRLFILNSDLSQQWFDQLANIQTLIYLQIEEKTKIKLSFVSKLPLISQLITNHHIDLREELKLELENWRSNHLYITIHIGENCLNIKKYFHEVEYNGIRYKYVLYKGTKVRSEKPKHEFFLNLEDLVRRNEEIRNEANLF